MLSQLSLKRILCLSPHNSQSWSHWRRLNASLDCYKYPVPRQQNSRSQAFLCHSGQKNIDQFSFPWLLFGILTLQLCNDIDWLVHHTSMAFLDTRGLQQVSVAVQSFGIMLTWKMFDISPASALPLRCHWTNLSGSESGIVQAASTVSYKLPS
jgi:hypothetical protein